MTFSVFLITRAEVIGFVPMHDFTFAYLKMHWDCLCPLYHVILIALYQWTLPFLLFAFSLAFTSSVMTLFSSRSVKLEEIRTDPMEPHWKTQFMSRYHVVMLVQCWAVSCLYAHAPAFGWELHSQPGLWLTITEYGWSRYESAFIWWSEYVALTLFVIISWTCNAIKKSIKPFAMI